MKSMHNFHFMNTVVEEVRSQVEFMLPCVQHSPTPGGGGGGGSYLICELYRYIQLLTSV